MVDPSLLSSGWALIGKTPEQQAADKELGGILSAPISISREDVDSWRCVFEVIHEITETEGICYYTTDVGSEVKQHPMDVKYPHVCFECHRKLFWEELLETNILENLRNVREMRYKNYIKYQEKYKQLKKLWRSPYVQLYCCRCYADLRWGGE